MNRKDELIHKQAREIDRLQAVLMDVTEDDIAGRLHQLRKGRKMSQKDFADFIGLSLRGFRNYENGSRNLPIEALIRIVVACDIETDWLLFGAKGRPK